MRNTKRQLKRIVRNSLLESSRAGEWHDAGYEDGSDGLDPKHPYNMDYMDGYDIGEEDAQYDVERAKHDKKEERTEKNESLKISCRSLRKIIREAEGSTKKYDDDSALKGDQSKLPDGLQKGIIDKTVEDREEREEEEREEKNESLKISRRMLRKIIKEEIKEVTDHWDNRDKIAMSKMAEPQQDPNIQKIEDIVYNLPNVTEDNFELHIDHDPKYDGGEYTVFHSGYAMEKLASLAGLRMAHEITSMFEDAGFEVGETWSMKEPVVLIDPKVPRQIGEYKNENHKKTTKKNHQRREGRPVW